jgi:ABC-2 type transport system permease protein
MIVDKVLRIARKEFAGFFASPIAFIFFGAFLAVTLFIFFWVETFFARNIADVRPMFEWMPVLLLFLSAAITMRMWSEERRLGTLEVLLTSPAQPWQFVAGKFLACLGLVGTALLLTLPLPITVSFIGDIDWGPVFGGYLATLFLAAAYIAIGLFVSARSDNQIISLIVATAICGAFYLLGSDAFTSLFGNKGSEFLQLLGSGSRFESITRGVIDFRDLYYYISLAGVFLVLNVFALEMLRWAGNRTNPNHHRWGVITALLAGNLLVANIWLADVDGARADFTDGDIYSISEATETYLNRLQEPLLIRGYFSAQTHPLLSPLVPRLRDLLEEYAIAGEGKVRLEFIDPLENPELEKEAGEKYGIQPVAFQTASKYQAAVVNSYFDIVVQYGDQHEKLGFRDLIEVKVQSETDIDVDLRNPEYDITRAIKKVLQAYQGSGQLFDNIAQPVIFKGYISPDAKLPEQLQELRAGLDQILTEMEMEADGKLKVDIRDPDEQGGALAQQIREEYGFRPMAVGLFDPNSFWFYMTLESGDQVVQVPLPEGFTKSGLEQGLDAALKRFSRGFLKTVALHSPDPTPQISQFGGMQLGGKQFTLLEETLAEEHTATQAKLENGTVPDTADLLLLVAPESLTEKQLFAVDQFLMRGGTVVLATSPFDIETRGRLSARKHESGLEEWLAHNGITIDDKMVLDPQNAAFPIPVQRNLGGFIVQETQMVEYPFFVDIREDGLNRDSGIIAGIDQVTLNWASPISVDEEKSQGRTVTPILYSSDAAWTSDSIEIQPDFAAHGDLGFPAGDDAGKKLLAVSVEGGFDSFFKDKPSPLAAAAEDEEEADNGDGDGQEKPPAISRMIDKSPESARIVVFASNTFLTDEVLDLAASGMGTRYLNPVQLVTNAVDWSLEDRELLSIRGRGHFSRTLLPLDRDAQVFWEYLNYILALLGLVAVWLFRRTRLQAEQARQQAILDLGRA